jgi:DNA-binding response OmpR family regulator
MQSTFSSTSSNRAELPCALRAFLAEHNAELRRSLSSVLRQEGYIVVELGAATHLVNQLVADRADGSRASYDLLVGDARMPGWSTVQLLGGLRGAGMRAPAVVIADRNDRTARRVASRFGAMVIDAPVDLDLFRAVVHREPDDAA